MNRALSFIISAIGLEKIKRILFNTAVYRLNSDSDFKDYAYQIYEECHEQASLDSTEVTGFKKPDAADCEIILEKFSAVGVEIPLEN